MLRTRVNVATVESEKMRSSRMQILRGVSVVLFACTLHDQAVAEGTACNPSTVAYWRFDGDFTDSCGALNGTPAGSASIDSSNIAPLPGNGGCLVLNGAPSRVDLPAPFASFIGALSEGTIEAWVYLEGPEGGAIFNHGIAARFTDLSIVVHLVPSGGYGSLLSSPGITRPQVPLPGFTLQSWHHLAWTWDAATITHYMDGAVLDTESSALSIPFTGNEAEIGSDDQETDYWVGRLDEIRLSNRALSPSEFLINTDPTITTLFEPPVTHDNFELQDGGTLPIKFHLIDEAGEVSLDSMDVRLEVRGPGEDGTVIVYEFAQADGSLRFDDTNDPPHYIANFNTKLYPVIDEEEYVATIYLEDVYITRIWFTIDATHGRGHR